MQIGFGKAATAVNPDQKPGFESSDSLRKRAHRRRGCTGKPDILSTVGNVHTTYVRWVREGGGK